MKKVYLACPYSSENRHIRIWRFEQVNKYAAFLMGSGFFVFSPISHTHPIAEAGDLPRGWEFWQNYDKTFLDWCDEMAVLMIDGWAESVGVKSEIEIIEQMGKPIHYVDPNNWHTK